MNNVSGANPSTFWLVICPAEGSLSLLFFFVLAPCILAKVLLSTVNSTVLLDPRASSDEMCWGGGAYEEREGGSLACMGSRGRFGAHQGKSGGGGGRLDTGGYLGDCHMRPPKVMLRLQAVEYHLLKARPHCKHLRRPSKVRLCPQTVAHWTPNN